MNWKRVFARLIGNAPHPRAASRRVHPKNVSGDFYVEDGCCTMCGVPLNEAPDHFADDDQHCYVKRQPANVDEVRKMISAMHLSEFDCIRYKGRNRQIINAIRAKAGDGHIDSQSN